MPDRAAQIAALSLPLDQLPDPLPIPTIEKPGGFDVIIRPPGSKSITNRALLLAALAEGTSELRGPLIDADDAQVMLRAIQQLGAKVEIVRGGTGSLSASDVANPVTKPLAGKPPVPPHQETLDILRITGVAGRWRIPPGQTITLNLNNAGTATRFLTAAAILAPPDSGGIIIDGDTRMRERPIGELAGALTALGAKVVYLGESGFPPLHVLPPHDLSAMGAELTFPPTQSSQFISALLLVAPFLPRGLFLHLEEPVTSPSYVDMTLEALSAARALNSVQVRRPGTRSVRVPGTGERLAPPTPPNSPHYLDPHSVLPLPAFKMEIPADDSGLAFFLAATTIIPGAALRPPSHHRFITFPTVQVFSHAGPPAGESPKSSKWLRYETEGDPLIGLALSRAGLRNTCGPNDETIIRGPKAISAIRANMSLIPDETMALAVVCCFATRRSELRGLRTLRVKETDRLAALQTELTKLGANVEIIPEELNGHPDESMRITPPPLPTPHSPLPPIFFDTYHDHRMAMSLALIGLRRPNVFIRNPACVAKTYPTFWQDLAKLYA